MSSPPRALSAYLKEAVKLAAVLPSKPVVLTPAKERHINQWAKRKGVEGVESKNLEKFWYNPGRRSLTVEFRKGGLYRYSDVPPDVVEGLREAESKGSFFHQNIRSAPIKYTRLV